MTLSFAEDLQCASVTSKGSYEATGAGTSKFTRAACSAARGTVSGEGNKTCCVTDDVFSFSGICKSYYPPVPGSVSQKAQSC